MRKPLLIWLIITYYFFPVFAQQQSAYTKLGASLKLLFSENLPESKFISLKEAKKVLSVILETNSPFEAISLLKNEYAVKTPMGTVSTVDVPVEDIYILAQMSIIKRIELPL